MGINVVITRPAMPSPIVTRYETGIPPSAHSLNKCNCTGIMPAVVMGGSGTTLRFVSFLTLVELTGQRRFSVLDKAHTHEGYEV
jgi:hypothetical protein